jgi:hypothetical protein
MAMSRRHRATHAEGVPNPNRISPFGEILADPGRGTWTGNRGCLHDRDRTIHRAWQVRRWITCRLEFRGRHRDIMPPGRWTALFFLDEASAFAAGHRPCGECRNADHRRFRHLWEAVYPDDESGADWIDRRLHDQRVTERRRKRTYPAELDELPDGAFIADAGRAWLMLDRSLLAWSAGGYGERRPRPCRGRVDVLTPPGVVAVFRAGYRPQLHPSSWG